MQLDVYFVLKTFCPLSRGLHHDACASVLSFILSHSGNVWQPPQSLWKVEHLLRFKQCMLIRWRVIQGFESNIMYIYAIKLAHSALFILLAGYLDLLGSYVGASVHHVLERWETNFVCSGTECNVSDSRLCVWMNLPGVQKVDCQQPPGAEAIILNSEKSLVLAEH